MKMSLANIQGKLSRNEMKNIMAGSGSCKNCHVNSDCPATMCVNWVTTGLCGVGVKHPMCVD